MRDQARPLAVQRSADQVFVRHRGGGAADDAVQPVLAQHGNEMVGGRAVQAQRDAVALVQAADRRREQARWIRRAPRPRAGAPTGPACRASTSRAPQVQIAEHAGGRAPGPGLPRGVGCRPRPVRMNSGAPKMSSSSAKALVTAGWLMLCGRGHARQRDRAWRCWSSSARWCQAAGETGPIPVHVFPITDWLFNYANKDKTSYFSILYCWHLPLPGTAP